MSFSTTTSRATFAGNDVSTVFSFPYLFQLNADLVVYLVKNSDGSSVLQAITTNYTVTGALVAAGGSVTMLVAPPTGYTLVIYRDPARTQGLHLVTNDPLPVVELEKAYDKLTMVAQRLYDLLTRSARLPDSFAATFDPTLPSVMTAYYVLRVNAAGTGFELAVMDIGAAVDITVSAITGLVATNVQAAIAELVGVVTGTRAAPTAITAAGGITAAGARKETQFIKGNAAPITVSANPQISAGVKVGDRLVLIARDATNTLTLSNGMGLVLNGTWVGGASSILTLDWDGTNWVEESRNDV